MTIFVKIQIAMELTPSKINTFLFFKLPSAFICGVRVKQLETNKQICKMISKTEI
jgi:hypothetical protein